ncbi:MAG: hypothetical protein IKU15_02395 [Clostridia bacterium]|nr:hypothetical protein [Clostridia bacterium]
MLRVKQQSLIQSRTPAPEGTTPTEAPASTNTESSGAATAGSADTSSNASTSSSSGANAAGKTAESSADANTRKMTELRNKILTLPFKFGSTQSNEIVDIVNDYPWIVDKITGTGEQQNYSIYTTSSDKTSTLGEGYAKKTGIPVCYVMERKSAVNAGVANIFNLISQVNDVSGNLVGLAKDAGGMVKESADLIAGAAGSFKSKITELIGDNFAEFAKLIKQNNLNDEVLNPYRYLYITSDTGKRFSFPMLNKNASSYMPNKNAWEKPKTGLLKPIQAIFDNVGKVLEGATNVTNMVKNITGLNSGNSEDNSTVNEAAKAYKYPTAGDTIQIQFTLYNTTRKDAWKDNFRFIYLFALRNLPMRTETLSFLPPCLYDIIVPGVKRMPVCGLVSFKVEPRGLIRTLKCPNFIDVENAGDENTTRPIPVSVPEAWDITMDFQSLIAPSANLMLSTIVGKLGIDAALDFSKLVEASAEEKASVAKDLEPKRKEMEKLCEDIKKTKKLLKAREAANAKVQADGPYGENTFLEMAAQETMFRMLKHYTANVNYDHTTGMPRNSETEEGLKTIAKAMGLAVGDSPNYVELSEQIANKLRGKNSDPSPNAGQFKGLGTLKSSGTHRGFGGEGSTQIHANNFIPITNPEALYSCRDFNLVTNKALNDGELESNFLYHGKGVLETTPISPELKEVMTQDGFTMEHLTGSENPEYFQEDIAAAEKQLQEFNDAVKASGAKGVCDNTTSNS